VSGPIDDESFAQTVAMVGGDVGFVRDLVAEYLADGTLRVADMKAALAAGEAEDLRRAAHTLKGSSASLGALGLADACRAIEIAAREGRLDGLEADIASVAEQFDVVVAALRERTGSRG
jgi:HPt (histidine-containing phosphotransfer) domain-containing protein